MSDEEKKLYWPDLEPGTRFVFHDDNPCKLVSGFGEPEVFDWSDWQINMVVSDVSGTEKWYFAPAVNSTLYSRSHNPKYDDNAKPVVVLSR
jgi:hypothetical protein